MVEVIERLVTGPGYVIDGGGGSPEACTVYDFAHGMAYYASQSPNFKGWYQGNTRDPILDVTEKVNAYLSKYGYLQGEYAVVKGSSVRGARLIIYGDDEHAKDIVAVKVGPTEPPARTLDAVVQGWAHGFEKERQRCPKDNNYYWVTYKCDLQVQLPNGVWVWLTRPNQGVPSPGPQPKPVPVTGKSNLLPVVVAGAGVVALMFLLEGRR